MDIKSQAFKISNVHLPIIVGALYLEAVTYNRNLKMSKVNKNCMHKVTVKHSFVLS